MSELITSYTDVKNNTHAVQHETAALDEQERRQIAEEIYRVLTTDKRK